MQMQQQIELESAHQRNAANILANLAVRRERLAQEKNGLNLPDSAHLANLRTAAGRKAQALEEAQDAARRCAGTAAAAGGGAAHGANAAECRKRRQRATGSAPGRAEAVAGKRADPGQGPAVAEEARAGRAAAPVAEAAHRSGLGNRAGSGAARAHVGAGSVEPRLGQGLLQRRAAGQAGAVFAASRQPARRCRRAGRACGRS